MAVNRTNQGNKPMYYIMCSSRSASFKFVRVNPDGVLDLTSCPHDCTLFSSQVTAVKKMRELQEQVPLVDWAVCHTRTHRPNEYIG